MYIRLPKQVTAVLLLILVQTAMAGKGGDDNGMNKLLAAGLVAKALAKGEGGGGGGGGHHFMPIHIPLHTGGGGGGGHSHHHHVHHKYVPIPVKHHTNFIIAHHKVHVPIKVPYPVYKTKIVHVPVEKTKVVPIIVNSHKGHHHHSSHEHYGSHSSDSRKLYRIISGRSQRSRLVPERVPRRWIVVVKHKHHHLPVKRIAKLGA